MWIPHRDQTASDTDCLFHFSAVKEVERKSAVMLPVKALVPPPRCYVDIDADQSFQLCFYSGGGRPCLKQRLWEMEPRYCFTQEIFIFQWAYCFTCTFSMHGAPQIIFCSLYGNLFTSVYQWWFSLSVWFFIESLIDSWTVFFCVEKVVDLSDLSAV